LGLQVDHCHSKEKRNSHREPIDIDHKSVSWDEMALYDFPTNINYILQVTGASKISYIGHSEVLFMTRTHTHTVLQQDTEFVECNG
jgi:hypothetical protein